MPIHFDDLDVISRVEGLRSALIVPCNMCPAVTVAVREHKPFLQVFKRFLKSAPFDEYLKALQSQLKEKGVRTKVFASNIPHQWFMCMWTARQRRKLEEESKLYDAVIVLGCDSATETVRDVARSSNCRVIEGMAVSGIMNARLRFGVTGTVYFEECKTIPIAQRSPEPVTRA